MDDFVKCVKMTKTKSGYKIECRLGLWSVEAPTRSKAESEAYHYFGQYSRDGEYSSIIGGPSVAELLMKKHEENRPR